MAAHRGAGSPPVWEGGAGGQQPPQCVVGLGVRQPPGKAEHDEIDQFQLSTFNLPGTQQNKPQKNRRTVCVYVCVHVVFRIWGKHKLKSQGCAKFWDSRYGGYIKVSWEVLEQ